MSKYGMSMCVLGMSAEFRKEGIAVNALWPRTTIATAAIEMIGGHGMMLRSRKPEIMADAAHAILTSDSRECTGNFFIDEDLLRSRGLSDFERYSVGVGATLQPDFFLE
jgi:citronellol/citronellal dehydrogenase